jgi:chromosome segregation ATPase
MLETKTFFGEADHPLAYQERLEAHIPQISHNITELRLGADGVLYGKLDVLDTPNGRIVKTLIDYGSKLGISSRGAGEVIRTNEYSSPIVNPDNYTFITFDLVVMPGAKVARLHQSTPMRESLASDLKVQLSEAISSRDIESLTNMRGLLEYVTDSEFDTLREQVKSVLEESTDTISDDTATEELLNAYSTISELEIKLSESTKLVNELTERSKVTESQIETSRNTISRLESELRESKEDHGRLVDESTDLSQSVVKLETENKELLESTNNLSTQLEDAKKLIAKYEVMMKDYQEEINDLTHDKASLRKQYDKIVAESRTKYESLEEELATVLSERTAIQQSYNAKLLATLNEYASLRCESVGVNPVGFLNESLVRVDSTIEDIDNLIREMLSTNTKSRLVESVSPMIIQDAKSIRSANSKRSSYSDDTESDKYLSDITETVARMSNMKSN